MNDHKRLRLALALLPQQLQAFLDGVIWLSLELRPEETIVTAGIPAAQLLHNRAAQHLPDRGRQEAKPVAAPSPRHPAPASKHCQWSSWSSMLRRCLISAGQPTSRLD